VAELLPEHLGLAAQQQRDHIEGFFAHLALQFEGAAHHSARLRRALLREAGGNRVTARVLALVPSAGLEAVLVAVELALGGSEPLGAREPGASGHPP